MSISQRSSSAGARRTARESLARLARLLPDLLPARPPALRIARRPERPAPVMALAPVLGLALWLALLASHL